MTGKSSYNLTFDKLVKSKTDIVGMLAYSIYKSELQAHIKAGNSKESFMEVNCNRRGWNRYKKSAEDLAAAFSAEVIDDHIAVIGNSLASKVAEVAQSSIKPEGFSDRFWRWHNSGLAGFVPTFWKIVLISLIALGLNLTDNLEAVLGAIKHLWDAI